MENENKVKSVEEISLNNQHENRFDRAKKWLLNFILPKIKFASTSLIATGVDYVLYLILVSYFFGPIISNVIAYTCGMLTNFILQKRFIFQLNRKVQSAFLLSLGFSMLGLVLETFIITQLNRFPFLDARQYITKMLSKGIVFFYNFYTKRFAFEKK